MFQQVFHIYISRFQREPNNFHFSSLLTDAVVVIYVVVLHYCSLISPSLHTHTEANRGCHCATVLSLVHHMLGSWQAGISLLPVNKETGSKANEGPSGTILHGHSAVAGV